jgi:ribosome recycling factor
MINDAREIAKDMMDQSLDRCRRDLAKVRAGRANPAVLDEVRVDSYGAMMPLKQVSNISVADARLLVIKPWDRNLISMIEKSVNNAGLGLNCNTDGVVVRVPIPPLTEERRKQLVKQVKDHGEDSRIAIRQGRREANDLLKGAEKDKEISEDALKGGLEQIQTLTNDFIKKIDDLISNKENEILEN